MTSNQVLETKFLVPPLSRGTVLREHLTRQLDRAVGATLTLVSAPAGFGKSTAMAELARRSEDGRIAWLSLDPTDDDPLTFWTAVVEAIHRAAPAVGGSARAMLAGGGGSIDATLTTLLNELAAATQETTLILDDAHVIESAPTHEQLAYLLEHLPPRAHVVIGTRADPPIPLARLRAAGRLVEIRASDLRFSIAEAAQYLAGMGLTLSSDDVATLEARTEGWIAALQLAALSLQGRSDPARFIDAFAGDDRFVVDYLGEEVLRRQPRESRDFLVETSILDRYSGPLADAVTERSGGQARIEALERANLFLVPLDDQRRWYRYHHLFGSVLRAHLASERPDDVPVLHRRASAWFEANDDLGMAIEHALRAGDADRAADLVERAIPEARQFRREAALSRWVGAIPRDVVARRPVLAVGYAGAILSLNEWDRVDELLTEAERRLQDPNDRVVVDEVEFARLPAMIELYRAALAKMRGDLEANIAHSRRVLEVVGEAELGRGGAETMLGLAYWELGNLEAGFEWYATGMASLRRAGFVTDVVGAGIIGADIRTAQGRLGEAENIYADGLAEAMRSQPPLRGAPDMHTGLADIAYRRNRLDQAVEHLEAGARLGPELTFPRDPCRSRLIRAQLLQAAGDLEAALPLFDDAERLFLAEFSPDVRPVAALRARTLIAHGRTAEARAWARRRGLAPSDELTYVREYEHTTLARLSVAEAAEGDTGALPAALDLLARLRAAAETGERNGALLDIIVVQALGLHAAGGLPGAFAALDAAIAIAEPEGYVRVFLDEGPAMIRLLKAVAKRSKAPAYLAALLGSVLPTGDRAPARQGLVEPLSDRELEVLRLLRSDLGGPDLANELVVSLNTLRTHTKNIYAKLGVSSRRAAIRRGEELGLL